jgi:TPR repeat protein
MRRVFVLLLSSLPLWTLPCPPSSASATDRAVQAMEQGDYETALAELRPLAEKNDPNAQFLLGMLHDAGRGVARDPSRAVSWYRKAAEQEHLLAQLFLGVLLHSGEGVKQDYAEAARWFRAPAESGNDQAQFHLGSLYATGNGVEKDDAEAIRWLTRSAMQRNTRAMGMLATELFSRSRDEQDLVDAYVWSHLAAEYDPVQATTSARRVIAQYCTDQQKNKGEQSIAEWKRRWMREAKERASSP